VNIIHRNLSQENVTLDIKPDKNSPRMTTHIRLDALKACGWCLLISALVIFPFFYIGEDPKVGCCGGEMPVTHDLAMHVAQMQGFHRGLQSGYLYPRWQEETNRGFGAPTTIFYPPAIYYLTSALYSIFGNWMLTLKALYYLLMVGSGGAIYFLARRLMMPQAATITMIIYLIAPYHLLNHYQRGAIAECLSFIWLPLILRFAWDLISLPETSVDRRFFAGINEIVGLSLSWGLCIFSHPPTAYQFVLIWAPIFCFIVIWRRQWIQPLRLGAGLAVGSMLAGSYLIPAIIEQKEIHANDVEAAWPYHESYVFLMSSARYDHRADDFVRRLDYIWLFTIIIILLIAALVLAAYLRGRRDSSSLPWLTAGLFASLMMTAISKPFGRLIPKIEIGVFSWRMLALTTLIIAILTGCLYEAGRVRKSEFGLGLTLAAVLIIGATAWMSYSWVIRPMYRAENFRENPSHSNYSTAPRHAGRELPDRERVFIARGEGFSRVERWEPELKEISVTAATPVSVSVRNFVYPGWIARVDGNPSEIEIGPAGEIVVPMKEGVHQLQLKFTNTWDRQLGIALTIIGALSLATLTLIARRANGRAMETI
jgi:hypothetical protein